MSGPSEGLYSAISKEMVRLYKEKFGRGPTKVRTSFAGPDVLVCTLEDSLTSAEQTLAAMGESQKLREIRMVFQYGTEAEFRAAVERVTGRAVRAFVSGIDTNADVSSEVFYLEQAAGAEAPADSV